MYIKIFHQFDHPFVLLRWTRSTTPYRGDKTYFHNKFNFDNNILRHFVKSIILNDLISLTRIRHPSNSYKCPPNQPMEFYHSTKLLPTRTAYEILTIFILIFTSNLRQIENKYWCPDHINKNYFSTQTSISVLPRL
jgi:hypothetical protein